MASSQAEYLKRYLSNDNRDGNGKKMKRVKKVKKVRCDREEPKGATAAGSHVRMVDDDDDVDSTTFGGQRNVTIDEVMASTEDHPEERPSIMTTEEIDATHAAVTANEFKAAPSRWQSIGDNNGISNDILDNTSPRRRRMRHDSDDDSGGDNSPPRRRRVRHDSDASVSERGTSPLRRQRSEQVNDDGDLSPPRLRGGSKKNGDDLSPPRRRPAPTARKGGLQNAKDLSVEMEQLREYERSRIAELNDEDIGRGAETVHRDRVTGKKIDLKLERLKKRQELQKEEEELEKKMTWGRGIVQQDAAAARARDEEHLVAQPFARTVDDEEMNDMLRREMRADDPMAKHLTATNSSLKKKTKSERQKYLGPYPPNRYNIPPGHRWDGVDRSNGFEKDLFIRQVNATREKSEYSMWSVSDM